MLAMLFLHGGGTSDHTRYRTLVDKFAKYNILGHAFDHHASSLAGRLEEAESELKKLKDKTSLKDDSIIIWGSSMGGHIACQLVGKHPIFFSLILQSAAAYSQQAQNIPFGPNFTKEITRQNSWINSHAFTSVNEYSGPILSIYGEFDKVIPEGVKARYNLRASRNGKHIIIKNVEHSILKPENRVQNEAWESMFKSALNFIQALKK